MTEEAVIDTTNDEYVEEVQEVTEEVTPETDKETSEAPDVNQENINKAINRKHFQMKEAERKAEAERLRAVELENKLQQYEREQAEVEVPDYPDPYDDDYEDKLRQRDQIIRQRAEADYSQQQARYQQEQQAQTAQQAKNAEIQKQAEAYSANAEKLGVTPEALQAAGQAIAPYVSEDLSMAILREPDGALITQYLASNFSEVDKLASMNTYDAAIYMETAVKAKVAELKPKQTNAPSPATDIKGGSVDPSLGKYPLTSGATFE